MIRSETAALLAHAAAIDNRTVSPEQVAGWAATLDERVGFDDALTAIRAYYAATRVWIMPAEINAAVLKLRADRLRAAGTAADIPPLPGQSDAEWRAALLAHRRRIADGTTTAELLPAPAALPSSRTGMRTLGQAIAGTAVGAAG